MPFILHICRIRHIRCTNTHFLPHRTHILTSSVVLISQKAEEEQETTPVLITHKEQSMLFNLNLQSSLTHVRGDIMAVAEGSHLGDDLGSMRFQRSMHGMHIMVLPGQEITTLLRKCVVEFGDTSLNELKLARDNSGTLVAHPLPHLDPTVVVQTPNQPSSK